MDPTNNIERPLTVITGASTGIGLELAKVFAENNHDLIIAADEAEIYQSAQQLRDQFGVAVEAVQTNLATYEGVETLYRKIKIAGQPVDTLVLNAGVGLSGKLVETDLEAQLNIVQLNIASVVHLTHRVLSDLLAKGSGRILFTSSIAAQLPGPNFSVYAASKSFIQSFAEAIRYEVKDKGITVTILQPGPTDTQFFERAEMENTVVAQGKLDDPAQVAREGFEALKKGKDHVVAGSLKNAVQAGLAKVLPETVNAALHAQQTKPKTA